MVKKNDSKASDANKNNGGIMVQVESEKVELLLTEVVRQLKISNAIALGQAMGQNVTVPVQAEKIARYLGPVETKFGSPAND